MEMVRERAGDRLVARHGRGGILGEPSADEPDGQRGRQTGNGQGSAWNTHGVLSSGMWRSLSARANARSIAASFGA
jgi:hypothetical protein